MVLVSASHSANADSSMIRLLFREAAWGNTSTSQGNEKPACTLYTTVAICLIITPAMKKAQKQQTIEKFRSPPGVRSSAE